MVYLTKTLIALGSIAVWIGTEKWYNVVQSFLESIHPHLSDVVLGILVVLAIIAGIYEIREEKRKPKKKIHSKNLVNTFTILSDGHYEYYSGKANFVIPYPYSEYKQDYRKMFYPTKSEMGELFNKKDWSDKEEEKHSFVSIRESNEGEFQQALDHLKSYKDILKIFDEAEKAEIEINNFLEKNKIAVQEMNLFFINLNNNPSRPQPKKDILERLYPEFEKLRRNAIDSLLALQKSLKRLAQDLEHGEVVKGKCELGY